MRGRRRRGIPVSRVCRRSGDGSRATVIVAAGRMNDGGPAVVGSASGGRGGAGGLRSSAAPAEMIPAARQNE